jgi:hypothetical protein
MLIGEQTSGVSTDYVPDALGSIVAAINQSLTTTYTAAYTPYGTVLASTGTAPNFTWVGSLGYFAAAGVAYAEYSVRARFPSSKTGRWTSVDPMWPGTGAYEYGFASPVLYVDAEGLNSAVPCKVAMKKHTQATWAWQAGNSAQWTIITPPLAPKPVNWTNTETRVQICLNHCPQYGPDCVPTGSGVESSYWKQQSYYTGQAWQSAFLCNEKKEYEAGCEDLPNWLPSLARQVVSAFPYNLLGIPVDIIESIMSSYGTCNGHQVPPTQGFTHNPQPLFPPPPPGTGKGYSISYETKINYNCYGPADGS